MSADRSLRCAAAAVLAALAALASPTPASAFCRTSSCPGVGTSTQCTPSQPGDCGDPIAWPSPCVSFSMQESASSQAPLATATQIFRQAFTTWMDADCPGGGKPRIRVDDFGPVECAQHEYNQKQELGNANIIIFRDKEWPHEGAGSTLALTTVTYNVKNHQIYDADMEVNSAGVELTTGDKDAKFDLLSIATHEAGHFLGLSHSPVEGATMTIAYVPGSLELRDLSDDDKAAICAIYPPGDAIDEECDATPRYGFLSECSTNVTEGCCAIAPGAPSNPERAVIIAALGALALAARRRSRAGAPPSHRAGRA